MSFMDCINGKVAAGLITKKQAQDLSDKYETLTMKYAQNTSKVIAAQQAAERIVTVEMEQLAQKSRNKIANALAQKSMYDTAKANIAKKTAAYSKMNTVAKLAMGRPTVDKEIADMLESAFIRTQSIQRQHTVMIADFIEQYSSKNAGLTQSTAGIKDVVRAILGDQTVEPSLAKLGKDVRGVFDSLHTRFRNAGGIIGKIPNYFPQVHVAEKVAAATPDEWKNYIRPMLDREKMINPETGVAFNDAELEELLDYSYRSISTNGMADVQQRISEGVAATGRGRDVASRRNRSRVLHFKDAQSFLDYNDKFGRGEVGLYDAVIGHVSTMSRDIGIMEKISPNANATMRFAEAFMQSEGVSPVKQAYVKGMYDVLAGRTAQLDPNSTFYNALMGYQNLHRAAVLGSAVVSALTDSTFTYIAAKSNGLDGVKVLQRQLSGLNPSKKDQRRHLQRMMFVAQSSLGSGFQAARLADDVAGGGKFVNTTRAISGITHRASGLAGFTENTMNAISLELSGMMAEMSITKTPWEKVTPEFRAGMIENGITEVDYEAILQATPTNMGEGATFMRPEDVAAINAEAARKLDDWLIKVRMLAANEPTLRTRAITTGAMAGDFSPVIRGSGMFMYKGFSITMFNNYLRPAIAQAANGQAGNLGTLVVAGTLLGGVAYQIKQMLNGKDPLDMTEGRFWKAAALQGGGLGFFGDFIFKDVNGYGRNLQTELMGPMIATANDVQRVMMGNFDKAFEEGKESKFFADLGNIAYRHIPGQSMWYGRLVLDRYIRDTYNRMTDPNYDAKIRAAEKRLKKETGQGYWFRPGSYTPQRLPDIASGFGG